MRIPFSGLLVGTLYLLTASGSIAQQTPPVPRAKAPKAEKAAPQKNTDKSAQTAPDTPEESADPDEGVDVIDVILENTLDMCRDGEDNDADSHVDCDDQDCEIFAICLSDPTPAAPAAEAASPTPPVQSPVTYLIPETGRLCRDGIDNDQNGLIDCHEPVCATSNYCRKLMYERPETPNKAPALLVNAGFGLAMPNYRIPTAETHWTNPETGEEYKVPFDPDMGVMLDLQIGYLFMPWIGAGVGFKSAFTFASNRELYFVTYDDQEDYKYVGSKFYGNMSAFLRFQWIADRFVPYVNLHVGYSVHQTTWHVYDPANSWSEVDEYEVDDSNYIYGERTEIRSDRRRHFTFAVEPGVDVFIVRRMFGLGIKVWLPVVANQNSEADNLGILFNMTFTPIWREPLQLRPEYAAKTRPSAQGQPGSQP